jgi:osmoprotectant transport system ATP-binding protein
VPADTTALQARDLHVRYDNGVHALRGVDLAVAVGESVALVGESGSGKTTLLKTFNRLVEPTHGEVLVEGRPAHDEPAEELRRRIGYVQQEGGLMPHWTVRRNVQLVPRLLGWDESRTEARARDLLAMVGLPIEEFGSRYPSTLSGGQRQRVAFARALAADPRVILMDEPFGALDPIRRVEMQAEFLQWKSRLAKTTLMVTHDLAEALRLCDRVAVLREGILHQIASPGELLRSPATDYVRNLVQHAEVRT